MDDYPSRGSKTLIMLLVLIGAGVIALGGIYLVNNGFPGQGNKTRSIAFQTPLSKTASQDPVINISGCKPVPDVLTIKNGAKVTFVNDDSAAHGLVFDARHYYGVLPHRRTSLIFDFYPKPGVWSYICDGRASVGLINILK